MTTSKSEFPNWQISSLGSFLNKHQSHSALRVTHTAGTGMEVGDTYDEAEGRMQEEVL